MSSTDKKMSQKDFEQAVRQAHNDVNGTLGVDGFLTGLVGRRVDVATSTTTIPNDTVTFTFSENSNQLYVIQLVYTDGSQSTLLSAERIA